jgi:uncharacterized protein (UPF0335 family)
VEDLTVNVQNTPVADEATPFKSVRGKIPMKETDADKAVADGAYRASADELRGFLEQIERLAAQRKDLGEDIKDVFTIAKSRGYDTNALRKLLVERKRDKDDLAEEQAVMDLYRGVLGMM